MRALYPTSQLDLTNLPFRDPGQMGGRKIRRHGFPSLGMEAAEHPCLAMEQFQLTFR